MPHSYVPKVNTKASTSRDTSWRELRQTPHVEHRAPESVVLDTKRLLNLKRTSNAADVSAVYRFSKRISIHARLMSLYNCVCADASPRRNILCLWFLQTSAADVDRSNIGDDIAFIQWAKQIAADVTDMEAYLKGQGRLQVGITCCWFVMWWRGDLAKCRNGYLQLANAWKSLAHTSMSHTWFSFQDYDKFIETVKEVASKSEKLVRFARILVDHSLDRK